MEDVSFNIQVVDNSLETAYMKFKNRINDKLRENNYIVEEISDSLKVNHLQPISVSVETTSNKKVRIKMIFKVEDIAKLREFIRDLWRRGISADVKNNVNVFIVLD